MAPHCARSCTDTKENLLAVRRFEDEVKERAWISVPQTVCTPGGQVANLLASFERQIHSFSFVNDHSGYKEMKTRRHVYRHVLMGQVWCG